MSRNRAVFMLAIFTALCAAVLMFVNVGFVWLRVLIGVPFVLLLPGQALMLFVDPDGQLGGFEWFALTVGASISLTTLVGMGLAASPLGLNADYLVAGLAFVVLLALIAARTPAAPPVRPRPVRTYRYSIRRASLGAVALIGCALLVLLLSIPDLGMSRRGDVVQLWGLPDQSGGLRIGANNINAASQDYRLTIEQGGRLISEQKLELPPGGSRVFEVRRSATWTTSAPVVAVLSATDGAIAPRSISVWTTE